jgi:hypothetical protein
MGLFRSNAKQPPEPPSSANQLPVAPFEFNKRYDVYCSVFEEERVYENIKFVGIRTFEPLPQVTLALIGGYLEIETASGARLFIPSFGIKLICDHGTQPEFKMLQPRGGTDRQ